MSKKIAESSLPGFVRMGKGDSRVVVPEDWADEARAVLFAARVSEQPFVRLKSFDTSTLNPLFSLPIRHVQNIAFSEDVKAPWLESDVDVQGTMVGVYSSRRQHAVPTLVLKLAKPMMHVALLAQLWAWRRRWKLHLQPHNNRLSGFIEAPGASGFGFEIDLPDEDAVLVANSMVKGALAPGLLALPNTYEFFSAIQVGSAIPDGVNVLENSLFFGFSGLSAIEPKEISAGGETRLVSAKEMAALLG